MSDKCPKIEYVYATGVSLEHKNHYVGIQYAGVRYDSGRIVVRLIIGFNSERWKAWIYRDIGVDITEQIDKMLEAEG